MVYAAPWIVAVPEACRKMTATYERGLSTTSSEPARPCFGFGVATKRHGGRSQGCFCSYTGAPLVAATSCASAPDVSEAAYVFRAMTVRLDERRDPGDDERRADEHMPHAALVSWRTRMSAP